MKSIPMSAVPSQTLNVLLDNQTTRLHIYQKITGLFIDVYVNDVAIITGVIARHANKIVRDTYLGFSGDLAFFDLQGEDDPDYTGLGARFALLFFSASEL